MRHTNTHIDDDLQTSADREVEPPIRQPSRHVAGCDQLPFKSVLTTDSDKALLATVRERLAEPMRLKVSLADL